MKLMMIIKKILNPKVLGFAWATISALIEFQSVLDARKDSKERKDLVKRVAELEKKMGGS